MTNTKHVEPNATQDVQSVGSVKRVYIPYVTWEDHQRIEKPLTVKTNILCPKCNKPLIKDKHIVLTTYPCKYRYFCEECGWTGTGF